MKLFIIQNPNGKQKTILADSKYHAIQIYVEKDGFLYSNSEYKEV